MKKWIAMMNAMLMLFSSIAAMNVSADEGMTAEEAQEQLSLYDEWYEKPPYYLGEDGVYYAVYDPDTFGDDFIWTEEGVPAGEYQRTRLLRALCAEYPEGKFAVQFTGAVYADDIQADLERLAQEGIDARVFAQHSMYPVMLYTVMDAGQLDDFPADSGFGYKMGLACNPQELPPRETAATNEPDTTVYGDVNGDGVVDILDVITFNRYLLGSVTLTDQQKKAGDCNRDGAYDATDSLDLLKLVVELPLGYEFS